MKVFPAKVQKESLQLYLHS